MKLRPWQKREIIKIYDNRHGTRTAILSFAKKNGKTFLAACLLLLHLCGPEAVLNTQLVSTAQSKEQAAVTYNLAAKMVRLSPTLDPELTCRDTKKEIYYPELGTLYKALSADAAKQHGQSPIFAIHDELGQVQGPVSKLYNAIENAMSAHDQPLSIVISTQAPTDADLFSILIDDALAGHDPHVVISLYTADTELDPYSVETVKLANPGFGDFQNAREIMGQAAKAKRMPTEEALYRNYTLNQRVEAANPFCTKSLWEENGAKPEGWGVTYGALDLSEVRDLTSFTLGSPVGGYLNIKPTFWLPETGLAEKARHDRVPYDVWAKQGFLNTTPGRSIEYEFVAKYVVHVIQTMDVRKIAYDRWSWRHFRPWLIKAGLSEAKIDAIFEPFGQGTFSMTPALRLLESHLLNGRIRHGMHPVLTMCFANAVAKGPADNRKFDKKRSRGRIDGAVTTAMLASITEADMNAGAVLPVPVESIVEDLRR